MTTPTQKQSETLKLEPLPETWPMQGPDFNAWNKDLSKFASIIERAGAFWTMDWPLKYLSLWTDTRDGAFLIFDRDKNKISADRVLAAIRKWDQETGEYTRNTRAQPSETPVAEKVRGAFQLGDRVTKTKGSQWTGHVVGFYSTDLTPEGYAVESETEKGSVQIYPVAALRSAPPSSAEQPEADKTPAA